MRKGKYYAKFFWYTVWYIRHFINKEFKTKNNIPLLRRIWLWKNGYYSEKSEAHATCLLNKENINDYLNDYRRFVHARFINPDYHKIIGNKLVFSQLLSSLGIDTPLIYCYFLKGTPYPISDSAIQVCSTEKLMSLLKEKTFLVFKPLCGQQGEGIYFVRCENDIIYVNKNQKNQAEFENFISGLDNFIVTEYIKQHDYSANIWPGSVNTIRALTMWDYSINKPFIAAVVHRFGNAMSNNALDNYSQGGLSFYINPETGVLGKGCRKINNTINNVIFFDKHPDTNAQVENVQIPKWQELQEKLLGLCEKIPYIPYIGWDIVITDDGFKIIEGNEFPGIGIIQPHFPLLKDPRIKLFFKKHGVI